MLFGRFNGVVLHFRDDNPEAANAIVFANSLGTDFRIWDDMAAKLGGTWRCLRYDLRGHGLSDAPPAPYRIEDHVADLAALMSARGIRDAVVVGLSVGGQIAQGLAAAHPPLVRALILSNTAHRIGTDESWNARIDAVNAGGLASIADAVMERWFSRHFRERSPDALAGYRHMLTRTPVAGYVGTCAAVRDADLTKAASRLRVPVLCLAGADDLATPPALVSALAALIEGAGFEIMEQAGHLPCVEQPARMAALIGTFATRAFAGGEPHV